MFNSAYYGKIRRINKIIQNGRMLVIPVDDSLIFGPFQGLFDIENKLSMIARMSPSAILGYKGSFSLIEDHSVPFILNVTASTTMGDHVQKIQSDSIIDALTMGADCIAVHINYTGEHENNMLKQMADIVTKADRFGMPVMAITYPRRTIEGQDYNYEDIMETDNKKYANLVSHCVRASVELGADIIKTHYTRNIESFNHVVQSAMGRPVIISGGPVIEVCDSYQMARDALDAGASGISYGRNIFNAKNVEAYITGMRAIVFHNASVKEALQIYKEVKENV